jgi:hypothetical protein
MKRFVLHWLAPILAAWVFFLPSAYADWTDSANEAKGAPTPAFPYTVAFLATIIVMVIVCMPSRKS